MRYDWVIQPSNRHIDLIDAIKLILDFNKDQLDRILDFNENELDLV